LNLKSEYSLECIVTGESNSLPYTLFKTYKHIPFQPKYMKKIIFSALLLFAVIVFSHAQQSDKWVFGATIFNTGSLLPGKIISMPIHPGFTLGAEYRYNDNDRHEIFQTAQLGYFFHRHAQHGIQLYSEFGYRFWWQNGIHLHTKIGPGYLHSIPAVQTFVLGTDGYESKRVSRGQFMPTIAIGGGYGIGGRKDLRVFLDYRLFMQMPFVREYVTILPNTALHLGVVFDF